MRKGFGKEAKLSFSGHALMENRHGLLVDFRIAEANGRAEREQAIEMGRIKRTHHPNPPRSVLDRGFFRMLLG